MALELRRLCQYLLYFFRTVSGEWCLTIGQQVIAFASAIFGGEVEHEDFGSPISSDFAFLGVSNPSKAYDARDNAGG